MNLKHLLTHHRLISPIEFPVHLYQAVGPLLSVQVWEREKERAKQISYQWLVRLFNPRLDVTLLLTINLFP